MRICHWWSGCKFPLWYQFRWTWLVICYCIILRRKCSYSHFVILHAYLTVSLAFSLKVVQFLQSNNSSFYRKSFSFSLVLLTLLYLRRTSVDLSSSLPHLCLFDFSCLSLSTWLRSQCFSFRLRSLVIDYSTSVALFHVSTPVASFLRVRWRSLQCSRIEWRSSVLSYRRFDLAVSPGARW